MGATAKQKQARFERTLSVLVVTADEQWQGRCAQAFLDRACQVIKARSGLQALVSLRKSSFDIVIADDSCFDMEPIEFTLNVRELAVNEPMLLLGGRELERFAYVWRRWQVFFAGPKEDLLATIPRCIHEARQRLKTEGEPKPAQAASLDE